MYNAASRLTIFICTVFLNYNNLRYRQTTYERFGLSERHDSCFRPIFFAHISCCKIGHRILYAFSFFFVLRYIQAGQYPNTLRFDTLTFAVCTWFFTYGNNNKKKKTFKRIKTLIITITIMTVVPKRIGSLRRRRWSMRERKFTFVWKKIIFAVDSNTTGLSGREWNRKRDISRKKKKNHVAEKRPEKNLGDL